MAENEELKAQIEALRGKIKSVRQQSHVPRGRGPGPRLHGQQPQTPYDMTYYRGRRGRGGFGRPRGNQLIVNHAEYEDALYAPASNGYAGIHTPPLDFVATHPHQLVNKDALGRQQRQQEIRDKQAKLNKNNPYQGNHEMVIDGIRFKLRDDGSKLTRVSGKLITTLAAVIRIQN